MKTSEQQKRMPLLPIKIQKRDFPQTPELMEIVSNVVLKPYEIKRIQNLEAIKLKDLIKNQSPWLTSCWVAVAGMSCEEIANKMLDDTLTAGEQTTLGNLMEALAVELSKNIYGGQKAEEGTFKGIDLISIIDDELVFFGIKSGPVWGNSSQLEALRKHFKKAGQKALELGWSGKIQYINGCAYGNDETITKNTTEPDEVSYQKLAGPAFWAKATGEPKAQEYIMKAFIELSQNSSENFRKALLAKKVEIARDFREKFGLESNRDNPDLAKILLENATPKIKKQK